MLLIYKDYLVCTTISISHNYCDRNIQLCRHHLALLIYVTAAIFNANICPNCLLESLWHDKRTSMHLWILSLPQHINVVKGEISTLYRQLSSSFRFRFTNLIHQLGFLWLAISWRVQYQFCLFQTYPPILRVIYSVVQQCFSCVWAKFLITLRF